MEQFSIKCKAVERVEEIPFIERRSLLDVVEDPLSQPLGGYFMKCILKIYFDENICES
jgi:hypothetical protein